MTHAYFKKIFIFIIPIFFIQCSPFSQTPQGQRVTQLMNQDNYEKAAHILNAMIKETPNNPEIYDLFFKAAAESGIYSWMVKASKYAITYRRRFNRTPSLLYLSKIEKAIISYQEQQRIGLSCRKKHNEAKEKYRMEMIEYKNEMIKYQDKMNVYQEKSREYEEKKEKAKSIFYAKRNSIIKGFLSTKFEIGRTIASRSSYYECTNYVNETVPCNSGAAVHKKLIHGHYERKLIVHNNTNHPMNCSQTSENRHSIKPASKPQILRRLHPSKRGRQVGVIGALILFSVSNYIPPVITIPPKQKVSIRVSSIYPNFVSYGLTIGFVSSRNTYVIVQCSTSNEHMKELEKELGIYYKEPPFFEIFMSTSPVTVYTYNLENIAKAPFSRFAKYSFIKPERPNKPTPPTKVSKNFLENCLNNERGIIW